MEEGGGGSQLDQLRAVAHMFCSVVRMFQASMVTLHRRRGLESTKRLVCLTCRKCEKLLVSVGV